MSRCTRAVVAAAIFGLALPLGAAGPILRADPQPPRAYRAQLFHVTGCPQNPAGDHFLGLDNLLVTMGRGGLKFYKSNSESPVAGPGGIIAPHDVVIIKINYQWEQRGGTDVDLLRGLIRAILDHPDGFTGEVVVCENAQFASVNGFDRAQNNAQDHALSPHDAVVAFQQQGHAVSHYDWTAIRGSQVGEYSAGDVTDGYVVEPYNAAWRGKLSYPKFRTAAGNRVSLRYGIWDPVAGRYDRGGLKFVNVPVLKSHHAVYGATASTKNYMGVITDQFSTGSHAGVQYGLLGALMSEIQMADLNLVDAIWINANPNTGPATTYAGATRRDELVASRDPIALDIWSVKNILIPGFLANGYGTPWPSPSADPDLPGSAFRTYLDNSMSQLLAAGREVTNDLAQIDVLDGSGDAGDFDGNGTVDLADYQPFMDCLAAGTGVPTAGCAAGDFDGDGDVDTTDLRMFEAVWTSPDPLPPATRLTRFSAERQGRSVVVRWAVAPSRDLTGFNVWRQETGGDRVRVSLTPLSGRDVYDFVDAAPPVGSVDYWLQEMRTNGSEYWYGPARLGPAATPAALQLYRPVPNPFNPSTTIRFDLPQAGHVRLSVYDASGRLIRALVDGLLPAGSRDVVWDGRDQAGRAVGSGSYFARVETGGEARTARMILVR